MIKQILLMLSTLLLFSNTAQAIDDRFSAEQTLETRLTALLRPYDPLAIVVVKLEPKATTPYALPMTPFLAQGQHPLRPSSITEYENCEVTILTRLQPVPDSLQNALKGATQGLGIEPKFIFESAPKSVAEETALKQQAAEEAQLTGFAGWLNQNYIKRFGDKPYLALLIAVLALGLVFEITQLLVPFITRALKKSVSSNSASDIIQQSLSRIAEAIEASESLGNAGTLHSADRSGAQTNFNNNLQSTSSSTKTSAITAMTEDGLLAILSDCYWCEQDQYATFLWAELSSPQRKLLLTAWPRLKEYVGYFTQLAPVDMSLENDPYYLNPIAIENIDNSTLRTMLLSQYSALYDTLSIMRIRSLGLSPISVLEIRTREQSIKTLPDFSKIPSSIARRLPQRMIFELKDINEEQKLLEASGITNEIREQIPTLGWLAYTSNEFIAESLKLYSAKDLATAWIGPANVLNRLAENLPEKKRALVITYTQQIKPSRTSPVFRSLATLGARNYQAPPITSAAPTIEVPSTNNIFAISPTENDDESDSKAA